MVVPRFTTREVAKLHLLPAHLFSEYSEDVDNKTISLTMSILLRIGHYPIIAQTSKNYNESQCHILAIFVFVILISYHSVNQIYHKALIKIINIIVFCNLDSPSGAYVLSGREMKQYQNNSC